jgi:FKBP-type peptidyl-prolyl cis-trans isomerase
MLRLPRAASGLILLAATTFLAAGPPQAERPAATARQARRQVNLAAQQPTAGQADAPSGPLQTQQQKVSYSLGLDIGRTLRMQQIEADPDIIVRGIQDGLSGAQPLLTDEQIQQVMQRLQQEVVARETEKAKALGAKNQQEGERFLAENKKRQGVVTLPSGLQYRVLKMGSGKRPKATDMVTTHYRGTLLDGSEFDSSYKRGEPASFQLNQVIPAWTEALQLMPVGSKWELYVPAQLAYGERGAGTDIGPNATLIFEVELLGIENSAQPQAGSR